MVSLVHDVLMAGLLEGNNPRGRVPPAYSARKNASVAASGVVEPHDPVGGVSLQDRLVL